MTVERPVLNPDPGFCRPANFGRDCSRREFPNGLMPQVELLRWFWDGRSFRPRGSNLDALVRVQSRLTNYGLAGRSAARRRRQRTRTGLRAEIVAQRFSFATLRPAIR